MTDDIFATLREMRRRSDSGGFDFMPPAPPTYYRHSPIHMLLVVMRVFNILYRKFNQKQNFQGLVDLADQHPGSMTATWWLMGCDDDRAGFRSFSSAQSLYFVNSSCRCRES